MSMIYFTLVAVALYFIADWLLGQLENLAQRRFEHRQIVFFGILLALALASFAAIRAFAPVLAAT